MNIGYIYKITNLINNKVYIGQTERTIELRWKQHLNNVDKLSYSLYSAIKKYGINNFKIEELEQCPIEELDYKEQYWIKKYNSYSNGYNENLGGNGNFKYNYNEIIQLWNEGCSCKEIINKIGCSSTTLTEILDKFNINKEERQKRGNELHSNGKIEDFIVDFNSGMSIFAISNKYSTTNERVRKKLIDNGITEEQIKQNYIISHKTSGKKRSINQYDLNYNLLNSFSSIKEAKISLGKKENNTKLNKSLKDDNNYHYYDGFYWKYADEI